MSGVERCSEIAPWELREARLNCYKGKKQKRKRCKTGKKQTVEDRATSLEQVAVCDE